jgi:hypothetical protein
MRDAVEVELTDDCRAELRELTKGERDWIAQKIRHFVDKGWSAAVADQSVKHLEDGIHELRVLGQGAAFRLLFFIVPGRSPRIVVLTSCAAKSLLKKRKRMEAEIARAKHRRAAWLEQMRRKEGADER